MDVIEIGECLGLPTMGQLLHAHTRHKLLLCTTLLAQLGGLFR